MKTRQGVLRPMSLRQRSTALAIGMSAVVMATPASAQESGEVQLETLRIEDRTADVNPNSEPGAPYKARTSGDERLTRPIAELPQTMTVLTEKQIEDSGYTDLVRILDAQPGITVGTGENGNAFGDRYIIRGQEARSDVFVDGLRDPGMTTRESFAVDQIEISKGPNSTFAGRGSAGGAINAITKRATTDYDFIKASIGLGTDRYVRATLDANFAVSDVFAVRANVLYGYTEIPDRGPTDRERKGLAVSATYAPTDAFDLTLDYYGLRATDNPDLGDFLIGSAVDGDRRPFKTPGGYAQKEDFQKSDVDVFTGRLNWQISDSVRFSNKTRYGMSDNGYVVSAARDATTGPNNPGGVYQTHTFSNHQGWQDVKYFANQANLHVDSELLGGENDLIVGAEYTDHKVLNGIYALAVTGPANCITGNGTTLNNRCGIGPDGQAVANVNSLQQKTITRDRWDQDWHVETVSVYLMDTIDLTEALTVFAGVRWDHFNYRLLTQSNALDVTEFAYSDSFWNAQAGITYDIAENAIVYASFATAADINGGESDVGSSASYGGLQTIGGTFRGGKPERSINWELGAKLNLFDEKLLLTAAVFQTTKKNVFEVIPNNVAGGYDPNGVGNTGKNRARGFELGVAGNITPQWSVQGGLTYLDIEVTESDDANTLSAAQLALGATNVGKVLANTAKWQASFQTRLQITDQFAMGAAVKHKGRRFSGQPDTAANFSYQADGSFVYTNPLPAYTVGDMFFEYKFNKNLDFRVNINNITDEDYYLAVYRGSFFAYKGDARQIVATLNFKY